MVTLGVSPQNPQVNQRIIFTWSEAPYITLYYSFYETGPWNYLTGPTNIPQIYYLVPSAWQGKRIYFRALDPTKNAYSNTVSIQVQGATEQLKLTVSPTTIPALTATELTIKVSPVDAYLTILGPGIFRYEKTVNSTFVTTVYPANSAQPITITATAEGYLEAKATINIVMAGIKLTIYVYGTEGPIPAAQVELSGPVSTKGQTDTQGNFIIENCKEGSYKAKASKSGYNSNEITFDLPSYYTAYTAGIPLTKPVAELPSLPSVPSVEEALAPIAQGLAQIPTWLIIVGVGAGALYLLTRGKETAVVKVKPELV